MSEHPSRRQVLWKRFPVIGIFLWEWEVWRKSKAQPCYALAPLPDDSANFRPFPIDMKPLLNLPDGPLDASGVPYFIPTKGELAPAGYHPTYIAQYALAQWNEYLSAKQEKFREAFLTQARWFVEHQTLFDGEASGWPLPFPCDEFFASGPWLSALTQGEVVAVLVRAYHATGDELYLQVARRALRTFERDIRAGGVSAQVGEGGVFFEEVAVYPAAHILNGYILGLFGLYDYVALTHDTEITALIERSLVTFQALLADFDLGYGSRYDLLLRRPASRFYHALHIILLEALAQYSGHEQFATIAARWASYQHGYKPLLNHIVSRYLRYHRGLRLLFSRVLQAS